MSKPVILHGGFDTIMFSLDVDENRLEGNAVLERRRAKLEEQRTDAEIMTVGGMDFKFLKYQIRGKYVFQNMYLSIFLNQEHDPPVSGTLHSFGLHKFPIQELWEMVFKFFEGFGERHWYEDYLKINRVDFKIDMHLDSVKYVPENVVSRAKNKRMFFSKGNYLNGFTVGKRSAHSTYLRIYDKRLSMEENNEFWYEIFMESLEGYERGRPVFRFEFESGRQWLKDRGIISWEDLKAKQGSLIKFLVHDFVKLVDATYTENLANKSRAPLLPEWVAIQEWVNHIYDGNQECLKTLDKSVDAWNSMNYYKKMVISSWAGYEAAMTAYFDGTGSEFNQELELEEFIASLGTSDYREKVGEKGLRYL